MIIVLEKEADGKIHLTKDDLDKMIQEAYDEGYQHGYNQTRYPQYVPITQPSNPWWERYYVATDKTTGSKQFVDYKIDITC